MCQSSFPVQHFLFWKMIFNRDEHEQQNIWFLSSSYGLESMIVQLSPRGNTRLLRLMPQNELHLHYKFWQKIAVSTTYLSALYSFFFLYDEYNFVICWLFQTFSPPPSSQSVEPEAVCWLISWWVVDSLWTLRSVWWAEFPLWLGSSFSMDSWYVGGGVLLCSFPETLQEWNRKSKVEQCNPSFQWPKHRRKKALTTVDDQITSFI